MSNFLVLDLELNQPSGTIIQVGAVVGNLVSGEVLERFCRQIYTSETINPFITTLTKITQEDVEGGVPLSYAVQYLEEMSEKHACFRNIMTWGGDDVNYLRNQFGKDAPWKFGHRIVDLKTVYQFMRHSNNESPRSGLAKSLVRQGLKFKGTKHNALDDAENTFILAHHLSKKWTQNEQSR